MGDAEDANFENTLTLGSQFSSLRSGYSFAISDVAYWNRELRDYEIHVLLGLTSK